VASELGATHWRLRPDVRRVADLLTSLYPASRWNTYVDHPFPGWDHVSFDLWGEGGRGHAIPIRTGELALQSLLNIRRKPLLRHWIFRHDWWTSWGGEGIWVPDDHSGWLRHLHVTFWL
jgi:hypothetical protein